MSGDGIDIGRELRERAELFGALGDEIAGKVRRIAERIGECLRNGRSVFVCGNGGSAAQAAHFAGELVGRYRRDRPALRVFALSENTVVLTSIANDYDFSNVFSRQVEGMANAEDCLFALSTSGKSPNVIRACRAAKNKTMEVFALTGGEGNDLADVCDIMVEVPCTDTPRIQELHLAMIHLICEIVEATVFPPHE